jgi:hypothetical protein
MLFQIILIRIEVQVFYQKTIYILFQVEIALNFYIAFSKFENLHIYIIIIATCICGA